MSDNIVEIDGKKYKAGPWKIWNGGSNPVGDELVQWQIRQESRTEAEKNPCINKGSLFRWDHRDSRFDIICYRVMEEHKPRVTQVVRWIELDIHAIQGVFSTSCETVDSVAKITFNLVDGKPDPKSIKMELM